MSWNTDRDARGRDQRRLAQILRKQLPRTRGQTRKLFRLERKALMGELDRSGSAVEAVKVVQGVQGKLAPHWAALYRQTYTVIGALTMLDGVPPGSQDQKSGDIPGIGVAWGDIDEDWWSEFFRPRLPADDWVDTWLRQTIRYADSKGAKAVKGVNDATQRKIQLALKKGAKEGESVTQLLSRIDRLYLDQIIPNRSEVIARTELLTASRAGDHNATLASGFADEVTKSWLTSGQGDRTRDSHLAAEASQVLIPYKEPFRLDGGDLAFPGDTSLGAPAEEVVQCMCSTLKSLPR